MRPSERAVHRARQAASMKLVTEDLEYFRVLSINPVAVVFFFGGYHIRFEHKEGRTSRLGGDLRYLDTDDYALMFKLADQFMSANVRGLNENKKAKNPKKSRPSPIASPEQLTWRL